MQEQEASHIVGHGGSTCARVHPRLPFTLQDHYRDDLNKSYVLTEVAARRQLRQRLLHRPGRRGRDLYERFRVHSDTGAVPPGPHHAAADRAGPADRRGGRASGEEIYVDKYGRVKVQFFWDREGKTDENSSCWIRVSQLWAGKNWGAMCIPRIGQEVIVDFLEGDPDRPIITGRVYNADQMPPYTLPGREDQEHHQIVQLQGRRRLQRDPLRGQEGQGADLHPRPRKIRTSASRTTCRESIGDDTNLIVGEGSNSREDQRRQALTREGRYNQKVDGTESLKVGQNLQEKVGQNYAL